jgi:hypothetical protein
MRFVRGPSPLQSQGVAAETGLTSREVADLLEQALGGMGALIFGREGPVVPTMRTASVFSARGPLLYPADVHFRQGLTQRFHFGLTRFRSLQSTRDQRARSLAGQRLIEISLEIGPNFDGIQQ